jgi:hypothetical protein
MLPEDLGHDDRGYRHKTKGQQMEEADPSMTPSHMYQMWGSGGFYKPLRE